MTEEKKPDSQLLDEINSLGQQLSTAFKSMWESEESRKLRQEIGDGFMELGQQLEAAISTAQQSEAAKKLGDQVKEATDRARASELTAEFERGLVTGLNELNKGLSKFLSSIESKAPAAKTDEPESDPEAGA
jgi:uncharacterized phage infection (PIP) family protein YhgE